MNLYVKTDDNSVINLFAKGIIKVRFLILGVLLLLIAAAIPGLNRLNIAVDLKDYFLEGDPVINAQKQFDHLFYNSDFIGILVESDDVFSKETLELIDKLSRTVKRKVKSSKSATSIVSFNRLTSQKHSLLFKKGKLVSTKEDLEKYRDTLDHNPFAKGKLYSADYTQAWIVIPVNTLADRENAADESAIFKIGRTAYEAITSVNPGNARVTPTGVPIVAHRKKIDLMSDLIKVLIIGAVIVVFLSIIIIRRIAGVAGTFMVFGIAVLLVFGLEGWLGTLVDNAFMSVPILLTMGVSVGYTIHINRFFKLCYNQTGEINLSIIYALTETVKPVFFTAFTTIVALLSFLFVDISPIRWVGYTSGISILVAFVLSITLFPVFLTFTVSKPHHVKNKSGIIEMFLHGVAHNLIKYKKNIYVVFIGVTMLFTYGLSKLEVDFDAKKMMGTTLPHMLDQEHISNSSIGAGESISLVIQGDFKDIKDFKRLNKLVQTIERNAYVKHVSSITKIINNAATAEYKKDSNIYSTPYNKAALHKFYQVLQNSYGRQYRKWITDDYRHAHLLIELTGFSSKKINTLIKSISAGIKKEFSADRTYFFSGSSYQMALMNEYITRGLIKSIFTALLIIASLMVIVFKSFKVGLIAMIPNIVPVIIAGGILGFAGVPLEFVTMTVAPIILGLAVDDTIHIISYMRKNKKHDGYVNDENFGVEMENVFAGVGTAVTETTIILCFTFLAFTFSSINSFFFMGIVASTGMLSAYFTDIFVTPLLFRRIYKQ